MTIPTTDAITHEYEGVNYHLCSAICASRFDIDAAAYVAVSRLGLEGWGRTPTPGFLLKRPPNDDPTSAV